MARDPVQFTPSGAFGRKPKRGSGRKLVFLFIFAVIAGLILGGWIWLREPEALPDQPEVTSNEGAADDVVDDKVGDDTRSENAVLQEALSIAEGE